MSAHWEELERIFAEAQSLPPADVGAFLARACGANAALRADAESLLSASNLTGEFMARPAIERLAHAFAADGLDLQPGRRIGAYTVVRQLGSGGAGEVWRARDERLGRDVAVKFLLPHLSADAERLRRFAEEARAAGALNHPNILTVHDFGEQDGMPYLVSECLEGRNLRERLKSAPLPVTEAVAVALGIAHGLTAAHERGIVHRDLKPENTFLRSDGGVKLLDFGLAKLKLPDRSARAGEDDTALSLVAGTAAYMAPEQVKGESPDPRADLFALGVMLYEMLTGQHPFRGASVLETLHAILTREPPDLASLDARVPPALARIVMRLLQKSPDARFQSARDLAWSLAQATEAAPRPAARKATWLRLGVPLAFALALALAGGWWLAGQFPSPPPAGALTRFTWALPEGTGLSSAPIVAPDGQRIAFAGKDSTESRLFVRELRSLEAEAMAGTDGAALPFWAPDGDTLGFFADGRLKKVSLPNGAPADIAEAPFGRGGAWTKSGTIVFGPDLIMSGLSRVSSQGGTAEPATLLDASQGETGHWWPVALPDGIHFLYFVRAVDARRRGIYLGRVDRPAERAGTPLFHSDSGVAYVPLAGTDSADLVYLYDGHVEVRRLDTSNLTVAANARTVDFVPAKLAVTNPVMLSASADVMAFADSTVPSGNRLAMYSMDGKLLRTWANADAHNWVRVSPDGRLIVRQHIDETYSQPDIWVEDLERGTVYAVSRAVEPDMSPIWSPDGRRIAFVTGHLPGREGVLQLRIAAADGGGIVRSVECPGDYCEPTDWSADGSLMLVNVLEGTNWNVWRVPVDAGKEGEPLLDAAYSENDARFSRDGRWVAYVSKESDQPEVWVQAVSGSTRRMVVSGEGGTQPVWSPDGKALYFVDLEGQLRRVSVSPGDDGSPVFGLPTKPDLPRVGFGHWGTQYDISPDGRRIFFMQPSDQPSPREIQVAIHWQSLLD